MENIESTERVNIGDQVVTAGIEIGGGIRSPYPKGLLIGQMVDVQRDANAIVALAAFAFAIAIGVTGIVEAVRYVRGRRGVVRSPKTR